MLTLPLLDGLGQLKKGVVGTVMASLSDDYTLLSVFSIPRTYKNFVFLIHVHSACSNTENFARTDSSIFLTHQHALMLL